MHTHTYFVAQKMRLRTSNRHPFCLSPTTTKTITQIKQQPRNGCAVVWEAPENMLSVLDSADHVRVFVRFASMEVRSFCGLFAVCFNCGCCLIVFLHTPQIAGGGQVSGGAAQSVVCGMLWELLLLLLLLSLFGSLQPTSGGEEDVRGDTSDVRRMLRRIK
jgi:hypothetical protein